MSDVTLLHYASEPVTLDRSRTYPQEEKFWRCGKPNGLWVSVQGDDDWEVWCRGEEFALGSLEPVHRVVLRSDANLLWLSTPEKLDAFHAEWSFEDDWERKMADSYRGYGVSQEFRRNQWPIDWAKVAERWDGVIIAPYHWSRRLGGPIWYYSVDCASGCIWNLDAIQAFEGVTDDRGVEANSELPRL